MGRVAVNDDAADYLARATERINKSVQRFCRAISDAGSIADPASGTLASEFQRAVALLLEGPADQANQDDLERLHGPLERALTALELRAARFDAALLVRPHTTAFLFDELKFGDILDHLNLDNSDDVDKLVDRVLAADDDSALDLAEDALGGVALGVDALGLAAKIKALVLLVIKLFLKIKYPDAPKEVERLLRMIARQLDKVGAGAIGAPGGPVTPAGTGGQATPGGTETDKSCVVQTYLKSIKALNLSNIGSRNKWTIDISIGDDDTHTFTDGSFDRSQTPAPFAPIQPEKNRRNIISFPNSGLIKLKVSIKATQSGYRTDDIGEDVVTIEFKCNEPKEDRDVEVRVHNDGKISEPFATLTFTFEISSACTGIPSHTR